jgi:hypothetical protein
MNKKQYGVDLDIKDLLYGRWTTEPPTQEGWYWALVDRKNPTPSIVHVVSAFSHGKLFIEIGREEEPLDWYSHWLGPLPVPEPPTEESENA